MLSFEIGGGVTAVERFLSGLEIFLLAESLGGVESLVSCPARMTHASLPASEQLKRGIADTLIRLSVGIENVEDLQADLENALRSI
jgi:cystathionine gamma-synthase/cystathionine gamma-lyase